MYLVKGPDKSNSKSRTLHGNNVTPCHHFSHANEEGSHNNQKLNKSLSENSIRPQVLDLKLNSSIYKKMSQ